VLEDLRIAIGAFRIAIKSLRIAISGGKMRVTKAETSDLLKDFAPRLESCALAIIAVPKGA
jgi:hypothetical protein